MFKRTILLLIAFVFAIVAAEAQLVELKVYREWRGSESDYKADRPFFLITDRYELERFWRSCNSDETMPWIDFEKYMIFVWHPGPSMFDHHDVRVERFVYKDGNHFILMNLSPKPSSGIWRRPFVATALPRHEGGDIFVKRRQELGFRQMAWEPIYTIWDMNQLRTQPLVTVQLPPEQTSEDAFITQNTASKPRSERGPAMTTPVTASLARQQQTQPRPTQAQQSKTSGSTAGFADDPFGGGFGSSSGSVSGSTPKAEEPVRPVVSAAPPALDDDPLFGSEFDIEF